MTVDSGHLWVAQDRGTGSSSTVEEFNGESGAFLSPQLDEEGGVDSLGLSGVAVGRPGGEQEVYVGAREEIANRGVSVLAVYGQDGKFQHAWTGVNTPSKTFGQVRGSAVSANLGSVNDLFVATSGEARASENLVDVFAPSAGGEEPAAVIGQIQVPATPCVAGQSGCVNPATGVGCAEGEAGCALRVELGHVAVSQLNGDVYVAQGDAESCAHGIAECVVDVFEPSGVPGSYVFAFKISGPPTEPFTGVGAMALDGEGDLYVVDERANAVDEFNAAGGFVAKLTETPEGRFKSVESVAADPAIGRVYVGDRNEHTGEAAVDVFGAGVIAPDVSTTAPVEGDVRVDAEGGIEATVNGVVNPVEQGETRCTFAWGTTAAFGQPPAACEPELVPEGNTGVPVHATIKGLAPDSTYVFRLRAHNPHATNPGVPSDDKEFLTPGPGIRSTAVSEVASTSATLGSSIDPNHAPTSYYFQYGTSTAYEHQAPAAPASLGSGKGDVQVPGEHVQSLAPGTVYHYRVVAISTLTVGHAPTHVVFDGPDQTFETQGTTPGAELPDGRQWELVSPPDKHGGSLAPIVAAGVTEAAASGYAISYSSTLPTEAAVKGFILEAQLLSKRGERGWSAQDIALPHAGATGAPGSHGGDYRAFSSDLSLAVAKNQGFESAFASLAPEVFPADTEETPYLRHDNTCQSEPSSCFEPLVTGAVGYADVPEGTTFGGHLGGVRGASPDLQSMILEASVPLTASPTGGKSELYEFSAGKPPTERLALVSLLPANGEGREEPAEGTQLGFAGEVVRGAVSADGSRVVWSTGREAPHLYMRDTAIGAHGQTVQLDAPEAQCAAEGQCGEPGKQNARFQLASSDGSRVFFTDTQRLTKDAGRIPGLADLYECEMREEAGKLACVLSDLTPAPGAGKAAGVQGAVIGASEDGSWVYFVANGVLGDGAARGASAADNLYVYHEGTTNFVTTLSGADEPDWASGGAQGLAKLTARVSPDGRWLAFMSDRPLTGYDNHDAASGKPDEEVFLYHAASSTTGSLACASCNPSGARPEGAEAGPLEEGGDVVIGFAVWPRTTWIAANVPGWTPYELFHANYQSRYLSDSGRLFFNSRDALVPKDINKNEDVYEFEPVGVGGCTSATTGFVTSSNGCVALISSGRASGESGFLDASESGNDVFFLTGERLVPKDVDSSVDVYDAHVCSESSPCISEPASPPACSSAESCRLAPTPQPGIFGAPSSATFSGPGNLGPEAPAKPSSTPPCASSAGAPSQSCTKKQNLAKALATCKRKYPKAKRKRETCERAAHKRYGPKPAAHKKKK
ncbi:MAG TPA: hypothetical protein VGX26_02755 [Solirubrobacteraceae bacterium]|jgi:hypothetical protein|nr:hypothetical protein [Solirubrobacteraceae bacterium]